jgi:hypothetical protein
MSTNPLMFSIMPIIGIPNLLANVTAYLTTICETSDEMVTITTPSISGRNCATLKDSSQVPGGKSISKMSSSPQTMSDRNWRIAVIFKGPR